MSTSLQLGHLKVIRVALSNQPLNSAVTETLDMVDAELAKHNVKAKWVALPKKPYQRRPHGEYQFVNIA
jgi:hypothetical protein